MPIAVEFWRILAGIVFFMMGMGFMEQSLQTISGRSFKLFLKKHTSSKPLAILSGAAAAAILQSSSIVNLMVLAFVGARVIQTQNALALIIGANFGTTLGSWIIALVGFPFSIEKISLPVVALSGIIMVMISQENRWHQISKLIFGTGFTFLGLGYIRSGMEAYVQQVDFSQINHYPTILFLLIGFVITAVIQSGAASIAIVLSALHANAISLQEAMAVVLGAESGTALKFLLSSAGVGAATKKRVAVGNLIFNLFSTLPVLLFINPIQFFLTEILSIENHLYALVLFQSLVNLSGIILFYPFLNAVAGFLEKRYNDEKVDTLFIHKVNYADTRLSAAAIENELREFIFYSIAYTKAVFKQEDVDISPAENAIIADRYAMVKDNLHTYNQLKKIHGAIHEYGIQIRQSLSDKKSTSRLDRIVASNRNMMYALKSIKDALPDLAQLRNSSNDVKYEFYIGSSSRVLAFCDKMTALLNQSKQSACYKGLNELYTQLGVDYSGVLKHLYKENVFMKLSEEEISTMINFNRELFIALKSYVFALKDFLLDDAQAAMFDELPGFVR